MHLLANIDVDDLPGAIAFYTRAFDLTVARRFGADGVELHGAGTPIFLLRKSAGTPATATTTTATRDYHRHWTPVHLDFVVDDVDAVTSRAVEAGATLESPPTSHAWGRIATLADPFGHGLCVLQLLNRGYDEIAS